MHGIWAGDLVITVLYGRLVDKVLAVGRGWRDHGPLRCIGRSSAVRLDLLALAKVLLTQNSCSSKLLCPGCCQLAVGGQSRYHTARWSQYIIPNPQRLPALLVSRYLFIGSSDTEGE